MTERESIRLIAEERERQISHEGWNEQHDDTQHRDGELSMAAVCYAAPEPIFRYGERQRQVNSSRGCEANGYVYDFETVTDYHDPWPWDEEWDKRDQHSRIRQLVIAGALIAAEIERLTRAEQSQVAQEHNPDNYDER